MIRLSNSTLSLYFECRRCFWLLFNQKLRRPQGIFSGMPIVVDSLIKHNADANRDLHGRMIPFHHSDIKGRLADSLFWDECKSMEYTFHKYGVELVGKPDELLEMDDGTFCFGDYKTAGKLGEIYDAYYRQQDIYAFLFQKLHPAKRIGKVAYLIYYVPIMTPEGKLTFHETVKTIPINPDSVPKLVKEVAEFLSTKLLPEAGEKCNYCRYVNQYNIAVPTC